MMLRLWRHISRVRRRQIAMLMVLMIISVAAELVSIGAVLPFIAVLASPDRVFDNALVANVARSAGIESGEQLILPLTALFVAAALLSGAVRLLVVWASTRVTFSTGADLSQEVYRRTLYQPYSVHIGRSSSEVISGIVNKVGAMMLGVLLPSMTLVSSMLLLLTLTVALIAIDPFIALVAAGGFGASYGMITWQTRSRLARNSQLIATEHTQVIKALQEGMGGIRDVLLDGTQQAYYDIYRRADKLLRKTQGTNIFIAQSPRYAMEAIGMVLIAALAYGMSRRAGGLTQALPTLGALALGAQRLLPALQQAYASWASIAGYQASLRDTLELLDQPIAEEMLLPAPPPMAFQRSVRFSNVRFRYSPEGPWVLDGMNLLVPRGTRVGFVGGTGSGKSTTMDLLMGLLVPTEGEILVDDQPIAGDNLRAWQRAIAHVPQNIYLADATLAENIAFGVPRNQIDMERVRSAALRAQIGEFIEGAPQGYDAVVGERGVRLSGGQRQRIGIARALYKRSQLLILDEATSALDNATERSVMAAIEALDRDLTILVIAHRLTTVQRCDTIVVLENGCVAAQGTYEQLLASSGSFRQMVDAAATLR